MRIKFKNLLIVLNLFFITLNHHLAQAKDLRYEQFMPNPAQAFSVPSQNKDDVVFKNSLKITRITERGIPYHVIESNIGNLIVPNISNLNEEALESGVCLRGNFSEVDLLKLQSNTINEGEIANFQVFVKVTNKTIVKK